MTHRVTQGYSIQFNINVHNHMYNYVHKLKLLTSFSDPSDSDVSLRIIVLLRGASRKPY